MIILPKFQDENLCYLFENAVSQMTNQKRIQFVLDYIKDVQHLNNTSEINNCIDLIERWLIDSNSVSNEQLRIVSNAASLVYQNIATDVSNANASTFFHLNNYYTERIITNAVSSIDNMNVEAINHTYLTARAAASALNHNYYMNFLRFYIIEVNLQLLPHSEQIAPCFNLNNQEEFTVALDFIQEYLHNDLLLQENNQICFQFYDFLKTNSLPELINEVFNNEIYRKQITRILYKMLEN